ncbi:MAG: hypothetical protein ACLFU6_04230 [Candidatus Hydrogenedentota bacterium]
MKINDILTPFSDTALQTTETDTEVDDVRESTDDTAIIDASLWRRPSREPESRTLQQTEQYLSEILEEVTDPSVSLGRFHGLGQERFRKFLSLIQRTLSEEYQQSVFDVFRRLPAAEEWSIEFLDLVSEDEEDSEDVNQFLNDNPDLRSLLAETRSKVSEYFPNAIPRLEIVDDPEDGTKELVMFVQTDQDLDSGERDYDRFVDEWWLERKRLVGSRFAVMMEYE